MLDCPVWVNQFGPNNTNARAVTPANQLFEPIGIDDFNIVIEKQQEITACGRCSQVTCDGVIKGLVKRDD